MKKLIISIVIACSVVGVGFAGYKYSTTSTTSKPKSTSSVAVQPIKTIATTPTQKTSITTNAKDNSKETSEATVAKFVPSKVINYVHTDSKTEQNTVAKPNTSETEHQESVSPTQKAESSVQTNTPKENRQTEHTNSETQITKHIPAIIDARDISIHQNSKFNWGLIDASVNQPDTKISFSGSVDTSKPGKYPVEITAINKYGLESHKTIYVIVEKQHVSALPAPVIDGSSIIIGQGGLYQPDMLNIQANVGGVPVPVKITGNVDNNKPGIYTVTATATNSQGITTTREFTVKVVHV